MPLKSILVTALLAAALCAAGEAPRPQWPLAPDRARLQYIEEIRSPQARPPRGRKWSAFLRWLLGEAGPAAGPRTDGLVQPTGVFARSGLLYVADPGRRGVLRYELAKAAGEWLPKSRAPLLVSPVAVAAAEDGRVFILDSALRKVFILDAQGEAAGELRGDPQGLGRPAGLAASDQRVYVSDVLNHRVSVYGLEGVFVHAFGTRGAGPGEFNFPTYLFFDRPRAQLWVSDSANFRLQSFDPDGRAGGGFGESGNRPGYLARPRGVARDSDGNVYESDGAFDALQLFDPRGRLLLFAGRSGGEPGQFNLPGGVAIDENDRLFVADTQNSRVQVFQYFKEGAPR